MTFGFIITRHVVSEETNRYWNECIYRIRKYYPLKDIVVIDDNSNQHFIKDLYNVKNVRYIKSEFPGAGEILPYYYLFHYRFFPQAVILHDSVFIHARVQFEILSEFPVMPIWHFNYNDDKSNSLKLLANLKNTHVIRQKIIEDSVHTLGFRKQDSWLGCYGVQSFISLEFLDKIHKKYSLLSIVNNVKNRKDRCCLERIVGVIFHLECPYLSNKGSLLGDIFKYQKWGLSYKEYKDKKKNFRPLMKVWTGR